MKNNRWFKFLVSLVAVVVIVESIIVLSRPTVKTGPQNLTQDNGATIDLTWQAEKMTEMGKSEDVVLTMTSEKEVAVDAVDLYIKYDPAQVVVGEVAFDENFVEPSFSKISQEKGLVVVNYLVSEPKGFALKAGEGIDLARLKVNYIAEGQVEWGIGEGTLVVESGSVKVLPFNSENLTVQVGQLE